MKRKRIVLKNMVIQEPWSSRNIFSRRNRPSTQRQAHSKYKLLISIDSELVIKNFKKFNLIIIHLAIKWVSDDTNYLLVCRAFF